MSDRRFLVLHLPQLATDRIRQKEPELAGTPIATWDAQGNRRVLTGVDAPGTTLHVGQALCASDAPGVGSASRRPGGGWGLPRAPGVVAMRFTPPSQPSIRQMA
jgi:protein ImuB